MRSGGSSDQEQRVLVSVLALALAACGQPAEKGAEAPAGPEAPDPMSLNIEIGRYGVMLGQVRSLTGERPGSAELDPASPLELGRPSHGANTLTDNNTVTSVNSGPQGVVANFVAANAESLTSSISVGSGSVTLAGWINFDGSYEDYNGYARLATADAWSSNTTPLAVYGGLGGLLYMQVSTDTGDTSLDSNARNLVGWHFVVVEMDTSVAPPRLRYSIDGAAVNYRTGSGRC